MTATVLLTVLYYGGNKIKKPDNRITSSAAFQGRAPSLAKLSTSMSTARPKPRSWIKDSVHGVEPLGLRWAAPEARGRRGHRLRVLADREAATAAPDDRGDGRGPWPARHR